MGFREQAEELEDKISAESQKLETLKEGVSVALAGRKTAEENADRYRAATAVVAGRVATLRRLLSTASAAAEAGKGRTAVAAAAAASELCELKAEATELAVQLSRAKSRLARQLCTVGQQAGQLAQAARSATAHGVLMNKYTLALLEASSTSSSSLGGFRSLLLASNEAKRAALGAAAKMGQDADDLLCRLDAEHAERSSRRLAEVSAPLGPMRYTPM